MPRLEKKLDTSTIPLVSADAHVNEPRSLWWDGLPEAMRNRAPRQWAQLEANPNVAVTLVDALDHSMFGLEGRRQAENVLRDLLDTRDRNGSASIPPTTEVASP